MQNDFEGITMSAFLESVIVLVLSRIRVIISIYFIFSAMLIVEGLSLKLDR